MNSPELTRLGVDVSEIVLQVHAVDDPRRGLFDPEQAERWVRGFALRAGRPFRVALPAYDVLDGILYRYLDQEQSRDEIVAAGFDAATVDKVVRLVRIGEWKRHQAAPGPKVSRRAFGRERRYPITSGWRG